MMEWIVLVVIFLLLWGGHWMRWRIFPPLVNERGDLHRPLAYLYGCLCILVGFATWCLVRAAIHPMVSVWRALLFLALDMVAAGAGTMAPRLVKWIEESRARKADVEDYEQAIQDRIG